MMRLPSEVRPTEYDLHLDPDLDTGHFRGEVRIAVQITRPCSSVVLHAADLTIEHAGALTNGEKIPARISLQRKAETVTLRFPRRLATGHATLTLRFGGALGGHLRGLYAATEGHRRYAFTQLEAADARRMFPCFDEPAFKARFRVSATVRDGNMALSNSPIEREENTIDGRRTIHFAPTPPLSTYLLALAIGPLEASPVRDHGHVPIRVWHVPGKGHLTDFGLEAASQALSRLESYFGLPYPYAKLDLVAVPDFEAGAMENAGAVFFRETLLLLDPATASLAERKRTAEVIAHELAHMWYGDLVTMAWWDDLWLNEAFATWMAYRVVDEWKPEWRMWESYEHDRAGALALDALANTHPIYTDVKTVAQATQNFDAITYEKGCAVVRMIEHYLGAEAFREGVRLYIRRHREGNAVARDLWNALEEASGREVARVAQAWIEKAGFPLVRLRPVSGGASRLQVRQERFFSDARIASNRRRVRWPLPLVVKVRTDGDLAVERFLVDRASQTITLATAKRPLWYFGNADAGGFYRVLDDPENRSRLVANLRGVLSAVERLALAGDHWELVRAGRAKIDSYLEIVDALREETNYDVLEGIAGPLGWIDSQVVDPDSPVQEKFRNWVTSCFSPSFERLGWTAVPGEDDSTRLHRAALLRLVGLVAEAPAVTQQARRRLDEYLGDRLLLEPNLTDAVAALSARGGDEALYERYRGLVAEARTPQERRRFLVNLASFRLPGLVERTLELLLTPEIPTQDVAILIMRLFANPCGREAAWAFFTRRWSALRKRIPPLMVSRLVEATPSLREPRYAREVGRFFRAHPVPEAARALKQALEIFRLNAELRKRTSPGLARWLARRGSVAQS